jgi:hypothetical protein
VNELVGVSAETSGPAAAGPGHPADPGRCHVEDGPAVSAGTAQMLACTATVSWMLHDSAGQLLDLGRRRRHPNAALRRAVRERDKCRCRFPGCESRRVDLHHIVYWSNGGRTSRGAAGERAAYLSGTRVGVDLVRVSPFQKAGRLTRM